MQSKLDNHYSLWIDGEWCEGSEGQLMQSDNPATGEPWASFACASSVDVARAIAAARRNLQVGAWADMLPTARGKLLYKLCLLYTSPSPRD